MNLFIMQETPNKCLKIYIGMADTKYERENRKLNNIIKEIRPGNKN